LIYWHWDEETAKPIQIFESMFSFYKVYLIMVANPIFGVHNWPMSLGESYYPQRLPCANEHVFKKRETHSIYRGCLKTIHGTLPRHIYPDGVRWRAKPYKCFR
jgi:hypothetical protein